MKKIAIIISVFLLVSCNSWLDVKPEDKLTEEQTFSNVEGFKNALNAIYIELNNKDIYGDELMVGYIEVLANRYYLTKENSTYFAAYEHRYDDKGIASFADRIWKKHYNLIANINLLIKNCDLRNDVLKGQYYNIIKGEALALRAFLHFDLVRLFGPKYDEKAFAIPYYTVFDYSKEKIITCGNFMNLVMTDLQNAKELLATDPIITEQPKFSEDIYNYFRNRTTRMNYYAVTLLRARAALWMDNKTLALAEAKEVIAVQPTHFPFSTAAQITNYENPDAVFSTELIFALENPKRSELFKSKFDKENITPLYALGPIGNTEYRAVLWGNSSEITSASGSSYDTDLRAKSMTTTIEAASGDCYLSQKYAGIKDENAMLNRLVPMLKVSEAFYIAAECETDETMAFDYLNKIRNIRGIAGQVTRDLDIQIMREYIKEFFCEGQLFYYYKRKDIPLITNGKGEKTVKMTDRYMIPVPDSENP